MGQQSSKKSSTIKEEYLPPIGNGISLKKSKSSQELLDILQTNVDICNRYGSLAKVNVMEKSGASNSGQILASLGNKDIFLKVFTSNSGRLYDNLLVEAAIYSCVIPVLIKHTPFLVNFLGYQECDGFFRRLKSEKDSKPETKKTIDDILLRIEEIEGISEKNSEEKNEVIRASIYDTKTRAYLLAIEQVDTNVVKSYRDWMEDEPHSLEDYRSVWFQILWTLLCFQTIGLRHNDLHWKNIWIKPEKVQYQFVLNSNERSKVFLLESNFKVGIFDFDRAAIPGLIHNNILDDLAPYGFGSEIPNYGYDVIRLVCYTKIPLQDLEEENPAFGNVTEPFLKFLNNFEQVGEKQIPLGYDDFCKRPTKTVFIEKNRIDGLVFVDEELIYSFDYGKILMTDSFMQPLLVSKEDPNMQTFRLPTKDSIESMKKCVVKNFPQILYKSPIQIGE